MEVANFSRWRVVAAMWWLLVFAVSFCHGDTVTENTLLDRLNKPYVKSIKSSDGDIIDCVHISQQPAFDHPSLKGHSIQMRPSYHPDEKIGSTNGEFKQMWQASGGCPEETIPIRRTRKEDLLRASSLKRFGKKQQGSIPISRQQKNCRTGCRSKCSRAYMTGELNGAQMNISLWAPYVQEPNEFSSSQLWITGGYPDVNSVEVGWHNYPALYGDCSTRLFIYWTSDDYEYTGCYNLLCSGFVQTNNAIALGGSISTVSSYGGTQHTINILIYKEQATGNWWLMVGEKYDYVGYWPYQLFTHINNKSASAIHLGGAVLNLKSNGYHTATDMGSGAFPNEGFGKASFFRNIQYINVDHYFTTPTYLYNNTYYPNCYDVKIGGPAIADWGTYFYYVGSGRNAFCP